MKDLNRKIWIGFLRFLVILAAALFLPAWTFDYWQAWLFLALLAACVLAITLYLMKKDPKLLDRRLDAGPGAEKETTQKVIQSLAMIAFVAVIVFPALDHRFGWSTAPPSAVAAGNVLVALGLLIVFLVFKENTFASATIEVETGQQVISTGPYRLVRHPMYSGSLIMLFGVPLALGSWWGLLTFIPFTLVLVWRLLDEEKFLVKNLPGYAEYRGRVRYHLLPRIW